MQVEAGKTYRVKVARDGYLEGDIFTVDFVEGYDVDITFDNGSPFFENADLMEVLELEEVEGFVMNIEVGKQYQYVTPKGFRPHPNEHIADGTIVTPVVIFPGGVMLEGYAYPHKAERLQELQEAEQSALEHTMKRLVREGHSVEDIHKSVQSLVDEAKVAESVTIDEMFKD